ncbi:hypothetical protein [Hespellia stercorisuis]|uniref:Uncharacterized protein n=1 Tax=Hespellia stercorisuis DSM 15480 TaxID=1121950 RepID=A0A1M6SS23_9FIRM|nr:hypothetical protein [Hespellia stercorisuis]SHK47440.1 hypothetical protein SAMN02745243_03019 [Hespellia stercorisuis DSM 15480]
MNQNESCRQEMITMEEYLERQKLIRDKEKRRNSKVPEIPENWTALTFAEFCM